MPLSYIFPGVCARLRGEKKGAEGSNLLGPVLFIRLAGYRYDAFTCPQLASSTEVGGQCPGPVTPLL